MIPEENKQVRFKLDGREYVGTVVSSAQPHSVVRFYYKTGTVLMHLKNDKLKKQTDDKIS